MEETTLKNNRSVNENSKDKQLEQFRANDKGDKNDDKSSTESF